MLQTDLPVLNALKSLIEGVTLTETTLQAVHVYPDDFKTVLPATTPPFAVVGVVEDSVRELGYSTLGSMQASYTVYARFFLKAGEVIPTTRDFAEIESQFREIVSVMGQALFDNENLSGTVAESGNIINTLEYVILNAKPFTGCQLQMQIIQEI